MTAVAGENYNNMESVFSLPLSLELKLLQYNMIMKQKGTSSGTDVVVSSCCTHV